MKKNKSDLPSSNIVKVYKVDDFSFESKEISPEVFSICVRGHRQNSRQGTVGCKDRSSMTSRSNKKPWKQKGTGRARAGSPRSPIWRGGGVSHGPRERVRNLSVNKKVLRLALKFVFKKRLEEQSLISVDWVSDGSCGNAYKMLKNIGLSNKKVTIFYDIHDITVYQAFSNLNLVNLVSYDSVFPYAFSKGEKVVFFEKDKPLLDALVGSWKN